MNAPARLILDTAQRRDRSGLLIPPLGSDFRGPLQPYGRQLTRKQYMLQRAAHRISGWRSRRFARKLEARGVSQEVIGAELVRRFSGFNWWLSACICAREDYYAPNSALYRAKWLLQCRRSGITPLRDRFWRPMLPGAL